MRIKATMYVTIDDEAWRRAYGTTGREALEQAVYDVRNTITAAFDDSPKWAETDAAVSKQSTVEPDPMAH